MSESFDVEAVPSFVLLRGHTLLSRISGANAAALSAAVSSHALAPLKASPLSSTNAAPRAAGDVYAPNGGLSAGAGGSIAEHEMADSESTEELEARCRKLMESADVVLFMKGNPDAPRCGFSQKTVTLLRQQNVQFSHFDILEDEAVRQCECRNISVLRVSVLFIGSMPVHL